MTDTQSIEQFINNGGTVGDAEKALQTGNKVAKIGINTGTYIASVGMGLSGSGAIATSTTSALVSIQSALATAGVTASVPVIGWVVAGVLVASAGGMAIALRRRAKFLAKDKKILENYIKRYQKKTTDQRLKEAKREISNIQYLLTKKQTNRNAKLRAKSELKLEALYYIYRNEQLPIIEQQAQLEEFTKVQVINKQNMYIYIPVALVIVGISYYLAKRK